MARSWGKVGTWADDSEAAAAAPAAALPDESFPSLGEAAATKTSKKKKQQTLHISELTTGKYVGPGAKRTGSGGTMFSDNDRLTSDEMMMLPTRPKDRSNEESYESLPGGRLGGGFRDYGGYRGDRERNDHKDREQRGGFGFEQRESSRADENDNWGSNKPSRGPGGRFGGGFDDDKRFGGDRDRDTPSKADEDDNWAAGKKFVPTERRSDDFGRGFGKADADDNWGANKKPVASEKWSFGRPDNYGAGPDSDKWGRKSEPDDSDRWSRRGSDEMRRPRLNLQPRTLPVETVDVNRPSSSHSSRPGTPETSVEETKPRQKSNPFGNAKPREVLLEEKGKDWRKMDMELEHRSLLPARPDTEEEKKLKEEISSLRELADAMGDPAIKEQLAEKEEELEQLSKEMDSKAKVSSDKWRKEDPVADKWRKDEPQPPISDKWRKDEPQPPISDKWRKEELPAPTSDKWRRDEPPKNAWRRGGDAGGGSPGAEGERRRGFSEAWKREDGRDRPRTDRW